jgi:glycosyltransferase involved in cell wall biosynthesis
VRISILIPTRNRSDRLLKFLASLDESASKKHEVEVVLGIDEDDIETQDLKFAYPNIRVTRTVAPRASMGTLNTRCLHASTGDIIMLGNDDVLVKSKDWDETLVKRVSVFEDDIYLAYPNDGMKGSRLSTFPVMSRKCIELIGHPYPECYQGACIDLHIFDIFQRLKKAGSARIIFLEDLLFEHIHFRKFPELIDSTYMERARFADDDTFITQTNSRRNSFQKLLRHTLGDVQIEEGRKSSSEENSGRNVLRYLKIAVDGELPIAYRTKLAANLLAKKIYSTLRQLN